MKPTVLPGAKKYSAADKRARTKAKAKAKLAENKGNCS
jgi:hypothetical protein